MRVLAVVAEEGGRSEQHGAVAVVNDFRNDAVVQRAGVEKHLAAGHQRQQHAAGEAEGVEQRQRHHELVVRRKVGDGADLRHVGKQRVVRMHDALGLALGAGRKQHHGGVIGRLRHGRAGGETHAPEQPELVGRGDLRAEVFDIDDPDRPRFGELRDCRRQTRFFDKAARSDDGFDAGRDAGRAHAVGAGRVVKQRRHALADRQRQNQHHGGRGVGHEQADDFAGLAQPAGDARQPQRHFEQRTVGFFDEADIFDQLVLRAENRLAFEKRLEQRALRPRRHQHVEQDVAHQLAGAAAARLGGGQIGHRDRAARQYGHRHLREQLARIDARQPAKIAARRPVDAHGDDSRAGSGGDEGGAVIDLHQRAGLGDTPFGKNHHRLAGFHQLDDLLHGQRTGGIDFQMRHKVQQKAKKRARRNLRMNDEHGVDRHHQPHQQAVEKGLVIGDDQRFFIDEHRRIAL